MYRPSWLGSSRNPFGVGNAGYAASLQPQAQQPVAGWQRGGISGGQGSAGPKAGKPPSMVMNIPIAEPMAPPDWSQLGSAMQQQQQPVATPGYTPPPAPALPQAGPMGAGPAWMQSGPSAAAASANYGPESQANYFESLSQFLPMISQYINTGMGGMLGSAAQRYAGQMGHQDALGRLDATQRNQFLAPLMGYLGGGI